MALIINFGTMASWQVRGSVAARYSVWRTLSIRTGDNRPAPSNWQTPATMAFAPIGQQLTAVPNDMVSQAWSQGDLIPPNGAALRGPAVVDQATGKQIYMNDKRYLEMVDQMLIGAANLQKPMPLNLANKIRNMNVNPTHPVLDHLWRFSDMGFYDNDTWRLKGWYRIEGDQMGDPGLMNLYMLYQTADQKILQNSGRQSLLTLDRDGEFYAWGIRPPDVYPSESGCELAPLPAINGYMGPGACACPSNYIDITPTIVQTKLVMPPLPNGGVGGLIGRIQGPRGGGRGGVPENLAQAFIGLYQREIQFYKSQIPPNQGMVNQVQSKIDQLNQFIAGLN